MKKIKIWFCDFWPLFDINNNFIINVLKRNYNVELDKKNPEYPFYSNFGYNFLKYNCVKIFYSGENVFPNFNLCDYSITCHNINLQDRHFSLPIFLLKKDNFINIKQRNIITKDQLKNKNKFCNFVYDNKNGDAFRRKFFEELNKYKKVDSAGKFLNNTGFVTKNKVELQKKYRFTIAFENEKYTNYCTEKIMDAFISRTIPIYWGDCTIEEKINSKAFINCDMDKQEVSDIIKRIKNIEENETLLLEMINQPIFKEENYVEKKQDELEEFLLNIICRNKKRIPNSLEAKRDARIVKKGCKNIYIKHKLHKIKVKKWKQKFYYQL